MLRLPSRAALFIPMLALSIFAQTEKLLAQQELADKAKPITLPAKLTAIKDFEQSATYWTSESGWDTELQLRNNLAFEPLTVTPVLRLPSGQEILLTAVTIPANASVSVSVNEELQQHAPNLIDQPDSYGSVSFRFRSHNVMNFHATSIPTMHGESVVFHVPTHPELTAIDELRNDGPGSLEGIWWQQRSGVRDILVIGNTSSSAEIRGTLSLFDSNGKRWSQAITLGPHELVRLLLSDLPHEAGLSGDFGGISFEVPAWASALDAVHLMYDEGGKFSESPEIFHRNPNETVHERTGDQGPLTMRAPMLALTSPDPALGLAADKTLQPTILVRNTTNHNVAVTGTLAWRTDSQKGQAKLPDLELPPFATKQLQIWAMQKQLEIPDDAHWALVTLTTNAAPEDLIAMASSRDCTGEYSVDTKFITGRGGHFAGGEWRLDNSHNQIAAITNVGSQPTDALLTLHYEGGAQKYELQQTIPPGDQMWVNLGQLVQHRVPDRNGNLLPTTVSAATYDLQDLTPSHYSLVTTDLALNTALGHAIPNCPGACCDYYNSLAFNPDPIQEIFGFSESVGITGINQCNNTRFLITNYFPTWGSSNSAIAQVTKAQVQGVGVGFTTGFAQGLLAVPGACACNIALRTVTVPITVGAVPTNFTLDSALDAGGGDLHLVWSWESNSGHLADLSACTVSENVTFPGLGTGTYTWLPPFPSITTENPTTGSVPGTDGKVVDDHDLVGKLDTDFRKPYFAKSFAAQQTINYSCTYGGKSFRRPYSARPQSRDQ